VATATNIYLLANFLTRLAGDRIEGKGNSTEPGVTASDKRSVMR
jgi:hypothetical protein